MEFKEFRNKLFDKAKREGFSECEVYYVDKESLKVSVYEGEVEGYNLNNTFGLSFRGKFNEKMGYSFTEILDEDSIDMLINNAKSAALAIESSDIQFIYEGDKEYAEVISYSDKLESVKAEDLINISLDLEKQVRACSDKVCNIQGCSVSYSNSSYGIYNTKGLELSNKTNLLMAYVVPVVKEGEEMYNAVGYEIANSLEEIDVKKIAKKGVDDALAMIGGKTIASGVYKTIIYNETMSSLIDTFSSIFSADAAQKGLSLLRDKEGEMIASDVVTIIDNPHLKNGLASTPFDDEGVATYEKEVVSNGKFMTFLHNLKTANKAGVKTTGNGFKAAYTSTVSVEPTNFYIKKGSNDLDTLMKKVGNGLLITDLAGLHSGANAVTGDFSLAAKGFLIENGKKSSPVEQITVSGNYFELLKSIEEVGSDLTFPMSSIGSPSVIVKGLSIAGK